MTEFVIKDIKDVRLIKSGEIVSIALPKSTDGSQSVEAPVINPNDCGKIGGWDIPENEVETCFEHRNVDGTGQATKPDDFCSWGKEKNIWCLMNLLKN